MRKDNQNQAKHVQRRRVHVSLIRTKGEWEVDVAGRPRFAHGAIVMTVAAQRLLCKEQMANALSRHLGGDWGTVCAEDWQRNDRAVGWGGQVASRYTTAKGSDFLVTTEWDRSVTVFLSTGRKKAKLASIPAL